MRFHAVSYREPHVHGVAIGFTLSPGHANTSVETPKILPYCRHLVLGAVGQLSAHLFLVTRVYNCVSA